ncbi:MAG: TetR/AcrR family transcriptional regulator, partial [Deltaproteobacteria bacterium]|nr:TetR/AcrR family transcriptional regulator [Deltaproteobacteria bacterium]
MDPDLTRKQILDAADALFGERGFDVTTTRDIAERSGVNKALIHYHFGSKDDLLEALLEGYYAKLGAALAGALGRRKGLANQVEDLLDAYADFLAQHHSFTRIVQREVASGRHVERNVQRTL